MHWKPWSIKVAALIGLGLFWFDKASDIKLLIAVYRYSVTGFSLLVLFIFQYFATAYTLALRLGIRVMRRSFCVLFVCTLAPSILVAGLVGIPAVLVLDVLLFLSDFGLDLACVSTRLDLDEYQLFRDISRAVFGTVPTVALQSVAFTIATSELTNLQLTSQVFITSFVAAAAQLLKVVGELFYLSTVRSQSVRCTFWQLLSAARVLQASPGSVKPVLPLAGRIQLSSNQQSSV